MEDNEWHDPLLLTDVSWQERSSSHYISSTSLSSQSSIMADPCHFHPNTNEDFSWQNQSFKLTSTQKFSDPLAGNDVDGRSMLGFSLTSPDLVICAGSPDMPGNSYGDSPVLLKNEYHKNMGSSIDISLEKGINGSEIDGTHQTPAAEISTLWQTSEEDEDVFLEASFELLPPVALQDDKSKDPLSVISINVGSEDGAVVLDGVNFLEDNCFMGGDTIRTDAMIGDGEGLPLYQTARFGNFSYKFRSLESGNYLVDLHLAEIVFTDGPPGMRVFDVFIQEQKVVSCIDIFARVGANRPLVISDLKTFVDGDEGLSIRVEGVVGSPIVCGISIRKDSPSNSGEVELPEIMGVPQMQECAIKESDDCEVAREFQKLQRDYEFQKKELAETKRILEVLKRDNQLKGRECQEAWKSLQDLQNELMRKSMHVGSLAFAIEGQVKEKSRWFSSLRDLTRKLKIMKMEHIKLSEDALAYKKCLADINEMSSTIQSTISHQVNLHEDLKIKFTEGAKERKELYNKVLELKGNIRVFCRCRPLNTEEIASGASMTIDFESARDGELTVKSNGAPRKTFRFDAVFGPQADQVDVFQDTAPFATSVLDGYNVCIFAYGQTGTGKTFTMEGTEEARGVNFRTLEELFGIIKERQKLFRYDISVSVLEVYNEHLRDLLVSGTQPAGAAAKRLEIRQVGEGVHHVPGLVEAHVNNMSEVWEVLQTGSNARAVGSTNANEHSSRSHCIHCVMVKGENLLNGEFTRSKLWLVDLAGSERVAKTEVQGERLKETQNINRSLSALGDVISALATKSPHIPFRNSKLTHLLQDSLGGDSKTLMFIQISPNESDLSETLCSLNFASRVRGIELGPAKKQLDTTELLKYKQTVEKTKQDIKSKDVQIKKMEETIHGLDLKVKERDIKNKNLQDKVKELESQLLIERRLARQHVDTKLAEQQQQQQQHQQMKQLQEEQSTATMRPPLANRPIGFEKNFNEPLSSTLIKDQVNLARPLTENNKSFKPPIPFPLTDGLIKYIDPTEKENNPEMVEQSLPPKRTGRASLCTAARRVPIVPAPRRNSLIPFPSAPLSSAPFPPPFLPLPPIQAGKKEDTEEPEDCLPKQIPADSPKGLKSGGKKLSSILRRSLQKKIQMKSPMQQHMRKGGVNVGMEKVRVSIGSRGRMAHRVLLSNARRVGTKEIQQKQSQKEKWNTGTAGRTVL